MSFYVKANYQELNPWTPKMDMTLVSISEADKSNGSPLEGDMIANSATDAEDMWLVAKEYFKNNYCFVSATKPT